MASCHGNWTFRAYDEKDETFIRTVSLIFISPCKPSKKHVLWQICYVEKKGTVSDNHVIFFFTEYFVLYIYNGNNWSNYKFMCCQIQRATRKNNMRCFDQSLWLHRADLLIVSCVIWDPVATFFEFNTN